MSDDLTGIDNVMLDEEDIKEVVEFEFSLDRQQAKEGVFKSFFHLIFNIIKRKRFMLFVFVMVLFVCVYLLKNHGYLDIEEIVNFIKLNDTWGVFLFVLIYMCMVVFLLPTLPFNFAAGFLWGVKWGTFYSVLGASFGGAVSFLLSKYILSEFFHKKFTHPIWQWLQKESKERGWRLVAFTRINPAFPFGPTNYFFGITLIPFHKYFIATILFIIPPSMAISALGASVESFILDSRIENLIRDIVLVSFAITVLMLLKPLSNKLFKIREK